MSNTKKNFWLTLNGLSAIALIGAAVFFLLAEHRAHFINFLPYTILLLCLVMHLFMHRGHGSHGRHSGSHEHDHQSREEEE